MRAETLALAKADYKERGYTRIPSVFTKSEVDIIRYEAYEAMKKVHHHDKNMLQMHNGHPALLFWPQSISEVISLFARERRMVEIVTSFLGPDTRQLNNQIYFREAGDGDEFAWHQDICFRTPLGDFENVEDNYLQTIIAIDEITPRNGAVEFIPGSHKWGQQELVPRDNTEHGLRKFNRGQWAGEKLCAQPGDVLLWSVMAVHGSEQNNTLQNRMTFMNGFCTEKALKNKSRFPIFTKGGKVV